MITFVLADSSLELIPKEIQNNNIIIRSAKLRNKSPEEILLDSNYHHSAMKLLKDYRKRGRPDIVHITLLVILDSILNKEYGLNLYVHTYNDLVLKLDNKINLPKSYNRFTGLMEQVLLKRNENPLIKVFKSKLDALLDSIKGEKIILSRKGKFRNLDFFKEKVKKDIVIVIGCFPYGRINTKYKNLISLSRLHLTSWSVASLITTALYEGIKFYNLR